MAYNTYVEDRTQYEFFMSLKTEIDKWDNLPLRPNERKTLQAIQILFDESKYFFPPNVLGILVNFSLIS